MAGQNYGDVWFQESAQLNATYREGGGALAAGGSILALIIMGLRAAFLVGGAYLMVHATDGAADINHLNNLKAIFGGILIVAALLFFRSSSSKSSSSD